MKTPSPGQHRPPPLCPHVVPCDQGLSSCRPRASRTWRRALQSPTASWSRRVSGRPHTPTGPRSPPRAPKQPLLGHRGAQGPLGDPRAPTCTPGAQRPSPGWVQRRRAKPRRRQQRQQRTQRLQAEVSGALGGAVAGAGPWHCPDLATALPDPPRHLLVLAGDPSPAPRTRSAAPLSPFSTIILIYLLL